MGLMLMVTEVTPYVLVLVMGLPVVSESSEH